MFLSVHRFHLFNHKHASSSKLESDHQPLISFKSHVSNSLLCLLSPESEFLSLKWLRSCLKLLQNLNNAFARLVVAVDYPMNKWESDSVDEYLNYTLHFLHLLNTITSSVSKLGETRVSLAHALTLIDNSPSTAVERMNRIRWNHHYHEGELKLVGTGKNRDIVYTGKKSIIHEALLVMENTGLWVCGIVLSGLIGDDSPYKELQNFVDISTLEPVFEKVIMEKGVIMKEVKEVNEAMNCVLSGIGDGKSDAAIVAAMEVERRLKGIEDELKGIGDEVNGLFSKVMSARNELLDSLRRKKNY